tara:strand:+ start:705 stop:1169 length:465 start_codon:yes stop_codon:yes gene_type:complete
MYAIVDVTKAKVVPQRGSSGLIFEGLDRVQFPIEKAVVFNPAPGYEFPPQYGEVDSNNQPIADPPVLFRLYAVTVHTSGEGPRITNKTDPVYDPELDIVKVTHTLEADLPAPSLADQIELRMESDPFMRGWVQRQAKKEGKTVAEIKAEIKEEL